MKCKVCGQTAHVALNSHNTGFCSKCFCDFFSRQVARGIESQKLLAKQEPVLVAISGGKDSLSLMLELSRQGYRVSGLFIDLAIPDSSGIARQVVERFCKKHGLDLQIISLADEGLAIPLVKAALNRPVCSACGKIKRHYFNRAAIDGGFAALATGHNLDDETARLLSNTMRWDGAYLSSQGPLLEAENGFARRIKPLWRLSEFETANYAFIEGIEHSCASCPYSPGASFTTLKNILGRLEKAMPGRKLDFYQSFLKHGRPVFAASAPKAEEALKPCENCGSPTSSGDLCGVCRIRIAVRERIQA
ncbi:MAG: adenine nucleotide alpha hydrolase family protein [Desulfovibrio sp.]